MRRGDWITGLLMTAHTHTQGSAKEQEKRERRTLSMLISSSPVAVVDMESGRPSSDTPLPPLPPAGSGACSSCPCCCCCPCSFRRVSSSCWFVGGWGCSIIHTSSCQSPNHLQQTRDTAANTTTNNHLHECMYLRIYVPAACCWPGPHRCPWCGSPPAGASSARTRSRSSRLEKGGVYWVVWMMMKGEMRIEWAQHASCARMTRGSLRGNAGVHVHWKRGGTCGPRSSLSRPGEPSAGTAAESPLRPYNQLVGSGQPREQFYKVPICS